MNNSNKIILNTGVTYLSLILRMLISIFSVRFVLQALGEEDYGVYVIVGGIVAMLEILNSNMSHTSMRYLAYSLGSKNKDDILVTFNSTVIIHYIIGFITILILEVGGIFMFEYVVNIPVDRMSDAKIIYQFMIATTFINIIAVPYDAVTNAHEHIWALSLFDVLSSCLVLTLSLFLIIYNGNRLILYGLCLFLIHLLLRFLKVVYAKSKFKECRQLKREYVDKGRIKGILSFTGWNLFGSATALGMTQFRSFILNYFFGVRLNAAEGVCRQVSTPLNMIVSSMTRAINPQIMKSEGGENRERMKNLVIIGAKYSSFLFGLFGIPVLIETPFLFDVWLGNNIPEFAVVFCQLSIVGMLMEKFTFQIAYAINAVGNIRNFQLIGGLCSLIYLPIACVMFKMGYPPVTIYILALANNLLFAVLRLHYGRTIAEINPWWFIKKAILPVLVPMAISVAVSLFVYNIITEGWINLIAVTVTFCVCFFFTFWLMGMSHDENKMWLEKGRQIKTKMLRIFKK